jgi:hypothetical protein
VQTRAAHGPRHALAADPDPAGGEIGMDARIGNTNDIREAVAPPLVAPSAPVTVT